MKTDIIAVPAGRAALRTQALTDRVLPVIVLVVVITVAWYIETTRLNTQQVRDALNRTGQSWTTADLIVGTWSMERPVLPTPDQVLREFWKETTGTAITSK